MILHGLFGPALAPKNLATVLTWIHFRGALALILLCAGNFFCLACPFMLVRNAARRFFQALDELAAGAAQQMGFRSAVCGRFFLFTSCLICGIRHGGRLG